MDLKYFSLQTNLLFLLSGIEILNHFLQDFCKCLSITIYTWLLHTGNIIVFANKQIRFITFTSNLFFI